MTTLGARLRAYRQQAGLTQRSLADGLVSKSMISQIESDKVQPSSDLLRALALRLGVTVEQLLPAKLYDQERLARFRQAQAFLSLTHYEEALPLLLDCLHFPLPTWSLVEISYQIAHCLHQLHRYAEARPAYLESIRLARKEQAQVWVIRAYLRLGEMARACGDWRLALQEWKLAERESCADEGLESEGADELFLQLAELYQELGWQEAALRYFAKATESNGRSLRQQVRVELGCGLALGKLGDWKRAEAHLRQARKLCEQGQFRRSLRQVEWELAEVLRRSGQAEEALELLEASWKRIRQQDSPEQRVAFACARARLLQMLHRHEEAVALLRKTQTDTTVQEAEQARVHLALAEVYDAAQMWEQALAAAKEAEKRLQGGGSVDERVQVDRLLADLYKRFGNFQQASVCQERAHELLQRQARQIGWLI